MTDWPAELEDEQFTPPFIDTWSHLIGTGVLHSTASASNIPVSTAWSSANLAVFYPFQLPFPYVIRRFFWHNGTAAGGNSDIGLYSNSGTAIFTAGAVAGSVNSAPQYITPANPIILSPDRYFLGFSHSASAANQVVGKQGIIPALVRLMGIYQQTGMVPLPSTATFVQPASNTTLVLAGFTRTASGF